MESGIVLYDIEDDGCLNGVYTNDGRGVRGVIYNEMARKKGKDHNRIEGAYNCYYFDANDERRAELEITRSGRTYTFSWWIDGTEWFRGTGYQMNPRQIAVHYHSV